MIWINITAVFQLVSFLFLVFVLKHILFKPVFAILDERKKRLQTDAEATGTCQAQTQENLHEYQQEITRARREALERQRQIEREAQSLRAKIISDKRVEAADELARVRGQLERETEEQLATLRAEVVPLRAIVADKVLGDGSKETVEVGSQRCAFQA
jgi:F-type H+-transporting ATPase subunit b